MYADAEAIAQAVAAIEGPVVVVAHSHGGIPTTQALPNARNVRRIIYLAAFQLQAGESLLSPSGGSPMAWERVHRRDGIGDYVEAMTPMIVLTMTSTPGPPSVPCPNLGTSPTPLSNSS
jgi:inosine-uridine nucleoside N-ribohydrolase